jgi:hydrogenase nickel incorporation protein HypA/HybF
MHELAICQSVLRQALAVAVLLDIRQIGRITLRIGPLAGVEPDLLRRTFPLVATGTSCEGAKIEIEIAAVTVRCAICDMASDVSPNRLLCASCGSWRVHLVSGDEMLLARIEPLDGPQAETEGAA